MVGDGADVVSVVVSVVVLADGGTASGVCGAGLLLPGSPDTNSATSTTATPNSAMVVATRATWVVENRAFFVGFGGVCGGDGGAGMGIGYGV